jgi:hypothetical protein
MTKSISHLTNSQIIDLAPAAGSTQPVGDVSSRYSFVPTLSTVNLLRDAGWFPISAQQSSVRNQDREGFQKHLIRFAKSGLSFDGERVDLCLFNSHDRGCAFKLIVSVWRKICGNGLMVSSEYANFTHKHVGFNPEKFIQSAQDIASSASLIADRVGDFKSLELTPREREILSLASHQLVYGDDANQAPVQPEQLLTERRYDDKGNDLWSTYNVIQENIVKGGLKGRKQGGNGRMINTKTRPVKSLDRNINLNKGLWTLTEKMAEIKSKTA